MLPARGAATPTWKGIHFSFFTLNSNVHNTCNAPNLNIMAMSATTSFIVYFIANCRELDNCYERKVHWCHSYSKHFVQFLLLKYIFYWWSLGKPRNHKQENKNHLQYNLPEITIDNILCLSFSSLLCTYMWSPWLESYAYYLTSRKIRHYHEKFSWPWH